MRYYLFIHFKLDAVHIATCPTSHFWIKVVIKFLSPPHFHSKIPVSLFFHVNWTHELFLTLIPPPIFFIALFHTMDRCYKILNNNKEQILSKGRACIVPAMIIPAKSTILAGDVLPQGLVSYYRLVKQQEQHVGNQHETMLQHCFESWWNF